MGFACIPIHLIDLDMFFFFLLFCQQEKVDKVKQNLSRDADTRSGSPARSNHCICGNAKCKVLVAKSAKKQNNNNTT